MRTASTHTLAVAFCGFSLASISLDAGALCFGQLESSGCTITPLPSPPGTPTVQTCKGTNAPEHIVAPRQGCAGGCVISGGGGPDYIVGSGANDFICGNSGTDYVTSGKGNDVVTGGGGPDDLFGGDDADLLLGGPGNDLLDGGPGSNVNKGDAGHDVCKRAAIDVDCEIVTIAE